LQPKCGIAVWSAAAALAWATVPAAAVAQQVLYAFPTTAGNPGNDPSNGVIPDGHGGFFGVASTGGAYRGGTAFQLLPPASGLKNWTITVLHDFANTNSRSDGSEPIGPLLRGPHGLLYGVTYYGGQNGAGTAFALVPPSGAQKHWGETRLYDFASSDGTNPLGGLVADASGALYGAFFNGGLFNCPGGCGMAFKLTPPDVGRTPWTETTIHTFTGGADGYAPGSAFLIDGAGTLYGVTEHGAPASGSVFKLAPPTAGQTDWPLTTLYGFGGAPDGAMPIGRLAMDPAGVLYGTTAEGGSALPGVCLECGTVFKLAPPAAGQSAWSETVLFRFPGTTAGGSYPISGVAVDAEGHLLGTTVNGGPSCPSAPASGPGLIFALVPPVRGQGNWSEEVFPNQSCDIGISPYTPQRAGAGLQFVGTAPLGGPGGGGTIYGFRDRTDQDVDRLPTRPR
jgi:hypothetical protein